MPGDLALWTVYLAVFLGVFLAVEALGTFFMRKSRNERAINRRLKMLRDGMEAGEIRQIFLRETPAGRGFESGKLEALNIVRLYRQSGLRTPLPSLAAASFGAAAALAVVSTLFVRAPLLQIMLAPVAGAAILYVVLARARAKRLRTFCEQLPDAIDVVVRSLRAGHPFSAALRLVSEEMSDPAGSEFGFLSDQLAYGASVEAATRRVYARTPADDLRYLAIALAIHERSGGNLSGTLSTLSAVIRERFALKGKIAALSAEGRFTAKLLSVFPLLLYGMLSVVSPGYFDDLWASGWGTHFVVFCGVMTVIGNIVVNRMVNLEV